MNPKLEKILKDSSLPVPYSVRKFTCPNCFAGFESIYYSANAMDSIVCDECHEAYWFSHRSNRLFNWDKSRSFPEAAFLEIKQ